MTHIVALHSYRGGTGKTNVAANLAAELARGGARVALVDTDIQSPGIHILFDLDVDGAYTINDVLWGRCTIEDACHDVTNRLEQGLNAPLNAPSPGRLLLLPASLKALEIARIAREGYDIELLNEALMQLCGTRALDYLILDTHPGLNNETLLSIAMSDTTIMVLRPDYQDYQGTAVTLLLTRHLEVPRTLLVVNKIHPEFDLNLLEKRIHDSYGAEIGAMLLLSDDLIRNGSQDLTAVLQPDGAFAAGIRQLAGRLRTDASASPVPPGQTGQHGQS